MTGVINPLTGESAIGSIEILFTGEAWVMIEQALSTTTMELFGAIAQGRVGYSQASKIVMCAHDAWRRRLSPTSPRVPLEDVVREIEEVGLVSTMKAIADSVRLSGTIIPREDEERDEDSVPFQAGPS